MMPPISELRLGRIALVGLGVIVISYLLVILAITVYAVMLGVQAQGAPDREQIAEFARSVSSWLGTVIGLIFIFLGATWTARRVPQHKMLHGLLVGIFVAIITIGLDAIGGLKALDIAGFFLAIGAGWLGGVVGAGRKAEV
jgi:putative membrane protein (TIGR04086 family)